MGQGGPGGGLRGRAGVSLSLLSLSSLSLLRWAGGVGVSYIVYSVAAYYFWEMMI